MKTITQGSSNNAELWQQKWQIGLKNKRMPVATTLDHGNWKLDQTQVESLCFIWLIGHHGPETECTGVSSTLLRQMRPQLYLGSSYLDCYALHRDIIGSAVDSEFSMIPKMEPYPFNLHSLQKKKPKQTNRSRNYSFLPSASALG